MDVHIYKKGKYLRTVRNISVGALIEVEGNPVNYDLRKEETSRTVLTSPQRWPNAGEEGGAEL